MEGANMELGDALPNFKLMDQNGAEFNTAKDLKNKACVIYFYPKNFTPGCTAEACSFRDNFQDFTDAGVQVIGISKDSQQSHEKFAKRYQLPFRLLADPKGQVARIFGVKSTLLGLLPGRETYVFSKEGVLVSSFKSLAADPHIRKSLKLIKTL